MGLFHPWARWDMLPGGWEKVRVVVVSRTPLAHPECKCVELACSLSAYFGALVARWAFSGPPTMRVDNLIEL